MSKARRKVRQDVQDVTNGETGRMKRNKDWKWKLRGYVTQVEYWAVAYSFPIAILISIITENFWKGLSFWIASILWSISGNLRGLMLHMEHFIEWTMDKNV